ncbi:MAG: GNAT family N-acetyltransferase [Bacteroidota bacterium]
MENCKVVRSFNDIDLNRWEEFVVAHPNGNVFQSSYYYEVIKKTKNWTPLGYFLINNGVIVGSLLVILQKEYDGLLGYFSSRAIIWGGPLIKNNDSELFSLLMRAFVQDIKRKAIYVQFRNLYGVSHGPTEFIPYKFKCEERLTIIIDLANSFESIFNNFHKSKKRNFTKSSNKGVIFSEIKDPEAIQQAYQLIQMTYSRILLPVPGCSHFIALAEESNRGICKFFAVYYEAEIIGVRVELLYNGLVYDYYAGHDENHSNKYPNDYLITNILQWGTEGNWKLFDFGGAGKPGVPYAVRDYKLKFSDNLVKVSRYTRINNKVLYYFAVAGFFLWKKTKRALKF